MTDHYGTSPYNHREAKGHTMGRLSKDARTEPRTTNRLHLLGNWKVTVALLAAMTAVQVFTPFNWLYWTLLTVYAVQVIGAYSFGNWWSTHAPRKADWRRKDSRTAEGDVRGTRWVKDEPCQCASAGRCDGTCHLI